MIAKSNLNERQVGLFLIMLGTCIERKEGPIVSIGNQAISKQEFTEQSIRNVFFLGEMF